MLPQKIQVFRFITPLRVLKNISLLEHYVHYRSTSYTANQKPMKPGICSADLDQQCFIFYSAVTTPSYSVCYSSEVTTDGKLVWSCKRTWINNTSFAAGNQQLRILLTSRLVTVVCYQHLPLLFTLSSAVYTEFLQYIKLQTWWPRNLGSILSRNVSLLTRSR
jgi:hypothetical protein